MNCTLQSPCQTLQKNNQDQISPNSGIYMIRDRGNDIVLMNNQIHRTNIKRNVSQPVGSICIASLELKQFLKLTVHLKIELRIKNQRKHTARNSLQHVANNLQTVH